MIANAPEISIALTTMAFCRGFEYAEKKNTDHPKAKKEIILS
jgi:hypothetical protein